MNIYLSLYLDYIKNIALLLSATVLFAGCIADGSKQGECTDSDLLNDCRAPVIRNEHLITSLDTLLQTQCSESQNGCPVVSANGGYVPRRWVCVCINKLGEGGGVFTDKHSGTHIVIYVVTWLSCVDKHSFHSYSEETFWHDILIICKAKYQYNCVVLILYEMYTQICWVFIPCQLSLEEDMRLTVCGVLKCIKN